MNAFYNKGADVVIGFTIDVNVDQTYVWTEAFMKSIAEGNTVAHAMAHADSLFGSVDGTNNSSTVSPDNRYVKGDTSVILCH